MIHTLTLLAFAIIAAFSVTQMVRDIRAAAPSIRRAFQDWSN